ncbi:hypothetical protein [Bacillus safensis]
MDTVYSLDDEEGKLVRIEEDVEDVANKTFGIIEKKGRTHV